MITVKHLSKVYDNNGAKLTVLRDVNCEIGKGEVISIIGPSGTGKSTFLRCINALETPTSGEVYVNGENIFDKKTDINKVRQKMGMVFQSFNLFNHLSILDNLTIGPRKLLGMSGEEAEEQAMELLKMVGLASKAHSMPSDLSGGQKQRVAIARCLSMKPEVILFDEPTSALDPTMVGEVLSVIRSLAKQGMTMLIVTHEMKFAHDVSSRIFFMYDGIIYEDDTPEVIFNKPKTPACTAFINKIIGVEFSIDGKGFDLLEIKSHVSGFCAKYSIPPAIEARVDHVLETMLVDVLPMNEPFMAHVDYSDKKERVYIAFKWTNRPDAILAEQSVSARFDEAVRPFCATVHDDPDGSGRLLRLKIKNEKEN